MQNLKKIMKEAGLSPLHQDKGKNKGTNKKYRSLIRCSGETKLHLNDDENTILEHQISQDRSLIPKSSDAT